MIIETSIKITNSYDIEKLKTIELYNEQWLNDNYSIKIEMIYNNDNYETDYFTLNNKTSEEYLIENFDDNEEFYPINMTFWKSLIDLISISLSIIIL